MYCHTNTNNELYHYERVGMKWHQSIFGSKNKRDVKHVDKTTSLFKKVKKIKDSRREREHKKIERKYKTADGKLTEKGVKRFNKVASNPKLANKQKKQALKLLNKNKKRADRTSSLFEKVEKITKNSNREQLYKDIVVSNKKLSKQLNKKISDITNDKIKAGKDFIVHTTHETYATGHGGLASATKRTIVTRK